MTTFTSPLCTSRDDVVEDRFAAEFLDDVGGAQDRGGVHGDVPHMEPLTA
ncbi:MAG: hypothetical protein ACLRWP_04840 [Bilophila wadsworthia]